MNIQEYTDIDNVQLPVVISHFTTENRKSSMDCSEGQCNVAGNFKSFPHCL